MRLSIGGTEERRWEREKHDWGGTVSSLLELLDIDSLNGRLYSHQLKLIKSARCRLRSGRPRDQPMLALTLLDAHVTSRPDSRLRRADAIVASARSDPTPSE